MSYALSITTANGVQTAFTFPGAYLSAAHVKVYVNGALKSTPVDYLLAGNTVTFTVAPFNGQLVKIVRETSRGVPLVDFQDAATITESSLDTSYTQALYVAQEAMDYADSLVADEAALRTTADATTLASANAYTASLLAAFYASYTNTTGHPTGNDVVYIKDTGAVGDGVANDTTQFTAALTAAAGKILDLQGTTIRITSSVSTVVSGIRIRNGKILFDGPASSEYAFRVQSGGFVRMDAVELDGNGKAAKGIWIEPNTTVGTTEALLVDCKSRNLTQTSTTGMAAAYYFDRISTGSYAKVTLINCKGSDISSSHPTTPVGRGILFGQVGVATVIGGEFKNIGPYQDGDGIFAFNTVDTAAEFYVFNTRFEDCQKRSIKSQVKRTLVRGVAARRNSAFTIAAGQSEIDLQSGGVVDGATFWYASGSAPQLLVQGWVQDAVSNGNVVIRNVSAIFDNPADTNVDAIVTLNQPPSQGIASNWVVDGVHANCTPRNFLKLYGGTGRPLSTDLAFDNMMLKNCSCLGFSAATGNGIIWIQRGASAYVNATVALRNCDFGPGLVNFSYLDPAAGSTTFLDVTLKYLVACSGVNTTDYRNKDAALPLVYRFNVAENAAKTVTFTLDVNKRTSTPVHVMYSSNRDGAGSKLYTEGYVFDGNTAAAYVETVAGLKTTAGQGTISVTTAGRTFAVSKTTGTLTASGELIIIVPVGYSITSVV